ncbi:transposase family protein [Myxococcota bacterium]
MRDRGWRRAKKPNGLWHVDVTVIKLLDGTKTYLHAIIDNFSRRILAWRLEERLSPTTTCELVREAGKNLGILPRGDSWHAKRGWRRIGERHAQFARVDGRNRSTEVPLNPAPAAD